MKRTSLNRLWAIGLALILAVSAFVPSARAATTHASPVTITVWTAYTHATLSAFNHLIGEFEAAYPNITVNEISSANYNALLQKESSAIVAGNTPTVAQAYEEWTAQFVKDGAVQDLTPYVNGKQGLSKVQIKDFFPKMWADGLLGTKRYLMPFSKSDIVLYFDGPLLRKYGITSPPRTWAQFAADAKKVTVISGGHPSQWGMTYQLDESDFYAWEYEWGGKVLNRHNRAAFGNKTGAAPLAFFRSLAEKQYVIVSPTANYQDQTDFDNGKSAFDVGSIAGLPYFLSGAKPGVGVGVAPFPAGPKHQATEIYGAPLIMFNKATSAEKHAGWLFMKFITEPKQTAYWSEQTGYMPVRQSAVKLMKGYYAAHPQFRASVDELKYALNEPALVGWAKARDDIGTYMQAALTGSKSPVEAVKEAANQVDSDLAQQ